MCGWGPCGQCHVTPVSFRDGWGTGCLIHLRLCCLVCNIETVTILKSTSEDCCEDWMRECTWSPRHEMCIFTVINVNYSLLLKNINVGFLYFHFSLYNQIRNHWNGYVNISNVALSVRFPNYVLKFYPLGTETYLCIAYSKRAHQTTQEYKYYKRYGQGNLEDLKGKKQFLEYLLVLSVRICMSAFDAITVVPSQITIKSDFLGMLIKFLLSSHAFPLRGLTLIRRELATVSLPWK